MLELMLTFGTLSAMLIFFRSQPKRIDQFYPMNKFLFFFDQKRKPSDKCPVYVIVYFCDWDFAC